MEFLWTVNKIHSSTLLFHFLLFHSHIRLLLLPHFLVEFRTWQFFPAICLMRVVNGCLRVLLFLRTENCTQKLLIIFGQGSSGCVNGWPEKCPNNNNKHSLPKWLTGFRQRMNFAKWTTGNTQVIPNKLIPAMLLLLLLWSIAVTVTVGRMCVHHCRSLCVGHKN